MCWTVLKYWTEFKIFGPLTENLSPHLVSQAGYGACSSLMGLAFIYLALPACLVVYVQKSDLHLINLFCEVIVVKKCTMSRPASR